MLLLPLLHLGSDCRPQTGSTFYSPLPLCFFLNREAGGVQRLPLVFSDKQMSTEKNPLHCCYYMNLTTILMSHCLLFPFQTSLRRNLPSLSVSAVFIPAHTLLLSIPRTSSTTDKHLFPCCVVYPHSRRYCSIYALQHFFRVNTSQLHSLADSSPHCFVHLLITFHSAAD